MERNLYDDEFEDFLKQKADQYKLYPSDKVWRGIFSFLHSGRKWYTITGALLLLTTVVFISLEIVSSSYNNAAYNIINDSIITSPSYNTSAVNINNKPSIAKPASLNRFPALLIPGSLFDLSLLTPGRYKGHPAETQRPLRSEALAGAMQHEEVASRDMEEQLVEEDNEIAEAAITDISLINNDIVADIIAIDQEEKNIREKSPKEDINWLQEMAADKLMRKKNTPFNLQFYFSPTGSYRTLRNSREPVNYKTGNVSPMSADPVDVDRIVSHQPALGAELGAALLFNVSDHFVLKAGTQLNYVHYYIKAYRSSPERTAITLSSTEPVGRPETITTYTSIRNLKGSYPKDLQNQYFQISAPIGAEFKLLGNKRLQLNLAGTIQPTYLLFSDTYLLSTDYGNYTKEPGLVRKWNVNAGIESYLSYRAGGLRWQVGPQFRYQLLSSYTDRYPIREYLMEYGIKIGVSKTLK